MQSGKRFKLLLSGLLLTGASWVHGGGITADVGLTPPKDRYIFRTQLRYMERGNDPTTMNREAEMYAVPLVLAYGLRSNLTVIGRQVTFHRRMKMPDGVVEDSGLGDFALITKWRLVRINKPDYIIGVAPTLGIELPTGSSEFGSDTFDAITGLFFTARRDAWGADLNLEYTFNGIDKRGASGTRPGDVFAANLALSYQFTLDANATTSLWPVLELAYSDSDTSRMEGNTMPNSGGSSATIAPGIKFARQSFMIEALLQFPLDNNPNGLQLEQRFAALLGIRYLF